MVVLAAGPSRAASAAPPSAAPASPAPSAREQALAAANRAYQARRFAAAASLFRLAGALAVDSGEPLVMSALAEYEQGNYVRARRELRRALARSLSAEDRALAETYLDLVEVISREEDPWPVRLGASLGGGFDSNVAQAPLRNDTLERSELLPGAARGGGFASAALALGAGRRFGKRAVSELEYSFFQIAYVDPALDRDSFQVHGLDWSTEVEPLPWLRLTLPLRGDLALTGLRTRLRPIQWSAGAQPEVALRQHRLTKLRLSVGYTRRESLDPALEHLSGERREVALTQDVEFGGWLVSARGRYRQEALGTTRGSLGTMSPQSPCPECDAWYVTPHSYQGMGASLRISAPWSWRVRPVLTAQADDRQYSAAGHVEAADPAGNRRQWDWMQRRDLRLGASAALAIRLSPRWQLTGRYEHLRNQSNLDGRRASACLDSPLPCHPLASSDRRFLKHTVALELEADWP